MCVCVCVCVWGGGGAFKSKFSKGKYEAQLECPRAGIVGLKLNTFRGGYGYFLELNNAVVQYGLRLTSDYGLTFIK